jgi:hypothetical protein
MRASLPATPSASVLQASGFRGLPPRSQWPCAAASLQRLRSVEHPIEAPITKPAVDVRPVAAEPGGAHAVRRVAPCGGDHLDRAERGVEVVMGDEVDADAVSEPTEDRSGIPYDAGVIVGSSVHPTPLRARHACPTPQQGAARARSGPPSSFRRRDTGFATREPTTWRSPGGSCSRRLPLGRKRKGRGARVMSAASTSAHRSERTLTSTAAPARALEVGRGAADR